jgi:hypothetical protein
MKRPKNFDAQYMPSAVAARQLRDLADHLEQHSDYACWNACVSVWRKEWDDPKTGGCLVRVSFTSGKGRKP